MSQSSMVASTSLPSWQTVRVALFLVLSITTRSVESFSAIKPSTKQQSYWTSQKAIDTTPANILEKIQESPWRGGLEPAVDIAVPLDCRVIQGTIPTDLQGTLFRNGPGRSRVGESLYEHWFDGDGYVVKLSLDGKSQKAILQGRYVQTERYQKEGNGDGGMKQRGAWTDAKNGRRLANLFKKPTNPGNTSCRVVKDKNGQRILLALAEGGPPHLLDINTLETLGFYDYQAPEEFGTPDSCASAHPVECPETNEMYTCGLRLGVPTELKAFKFVPKLDSSGSLQLDATNTVAMSDISFVHDMAISGKHVVFVIPPYSATSKDLIMSVFTTPPLGQRFKWNIDNGTRIVVLKRDDMSVVADVTTMEYLSTYHIVNAHDLDDKGLVEVQVAAHNGPRDSVEDVFKNMYTKVFTDEQRCRLRSIKVNHDNKVEIKDFGPSSASAFELPSVHPDYIGKSQRYIFTNCAYPSSAQVVNSVERLDLKTNEVDRATFGPDRFAMEPVLVPKQTPNKDELNAYALTLVYDSSLHVTDCFILDASRLSAGPIATVRLPSHVPFGFHGTWCDDIFLEW